MEILHYSPEYRDDVLTLWNTAGVKQGFIPADMETLEKLILCHPDFSCDHAFILKDGETAAGFICGCAGDDLPRGKERGYFTCLLLSDGADGSGLADALEDSFRRIGKQQIVCSFFNPMRLPWTIPGTSGHLHNNTPGIAVDLPLYSQLIQRGYTVAARECAMYLKWDDFVVPDWLEEKSERAAQQGYTVDWYDKSKHTGLKAMVDSMGNPQWSAEVPHAADNINMIVALKGDEVVGFTGPIYAEASGRGYFAGIAVSADHEKRGLGTLLFYRLCIEEKAAGADYMSLFTGDDNHAQSIYLKAGFEVKRIFAVLVKAL